MSERISVNEAAEEAGVSPSAVRRWVKLGVLPAIQFPGVGKQPIIRILRSELEAFIKRCDTRLQSSTNLTVLTPDQKKRLATGTR